MSETASIRSPPPTVSTAAPLAGWTVILTRPVGAADAWRRPLAAAGAQVMALPGLAIRPQADPARIRALLQSARGDSAWLFTSPVAVDQARRLIEAWPATALMAVGQATAARLRRLGAPRVVTPDARQDSEGLLALPGLQQVAGQRLTLVTGAGGRGLLQAELRRRGAEVNVVEVYARVAPRLDRRHFERLRTLPSRAILLISSAEAMGHLQAVLPAPLWQRLLACPVVVSSARMDGLAGRAGFNTRCRAGSALRADMQAAAEQFALRKEGL